MLRIYAIKTLCVLRESAVKKPAFIPLSLINHTLADCPLPPVQP
jgi:hypothetical protein